MSINLTVVIDNDEAIKKFKELQKVAKSTTSNIVTDSERMDMAIRKFGSALASIGLGFSFTELARQVATVRGEFQQLEVAFATMLGNKAEADALMQRTVELAATTPFDLQGVAQGTKQLLAFGSTSQEVTGEIKMIGNIAAGLSIPLGDLVYLYGTTRTQGRLFTQDLRQFMGRGIPLAEELAKQFGVTKDKVGELVTAGKVGFADVKKALVSMTSEGGKFYNLMEEQSKTISGQMSNLGDSIQQMFNEIGKQSEGAISKAIESASYLVENYEKVGKVLIDIVAAYGSYKAAVMIVNGVIKVRTALLAAETLALRANALAHTNLTKATVLLTKALKAMNVTALANPYVLAGVAVAGLTFGIYKLITAKSEEKKAHEDVTEAIDKNNKSLEESTQKALEAAKAMSDVNSTAYERKKGYDDLISIYPELLQKYDEEKVKLMSVADAERELALLESERRKANAEAKRDELQQEYDELRSQRVVNFVNGERRITTGADSKRGNYLEAAIADWNAKIEEERHIQERIAFDALSIEEKIAAYEKQNSILEDRIIEYTNKVNEQVELGDSYMASVFTDIVNKAKSEQAVIQRNIESLKKIADENNPNKGEDEDEKKAKVIANARKKAQEEAHKEEIEAKKAQIKDKVELLEYEKDEELKAIRERIMAEKDAIVEQSLVDLWHATYEKFDNQIKAAIKDKNVKGIVSNLTFDLPEWTKIGDLGIQDPSVVIKDNDKENIPEVMALFGDLSRVGAESLREIAKEARAAMGAISDPKDAAVISDKIDEIEDKADSLEPPLKRLGKNIKDLFTSDIDSEAWRDAFVELGDSFQDIIAYTTALDDVLDSIGHGGALDGAIDGLNAAFSAFQAAGKGAKIGSVFGPLGAAAGAVIGAVGSLVKSISQIHDKKKEKSIQRLQEQIETLEGSYERLGRAVDDAYSTDASALIEQQNQLLRQQKALIEQQIDEEEDKKKTDKDRIKDWQKQIEDIDNDIADNAAKAQEAITGISFDGFYNSFVDTLADMSSSSEDFADNFEDYLKKSILSALIAEQYKDKIQALYDNFAKANEDSEITQQEIEALRAENDALVNNMIKDRDNLAKAYGWTNDSGDSGSKSSGGFQTMSQETGSELNGRFTDIQGKVTDIRSFVIEIMNMGKMQYAETVNIRDIMIQLNGNVGDIKSYTKVLPAMLESINTMSKKLDNL